MFTTGALLAVPRKSVGLAAAAAAAAAAAVACCAALPAQRLFVDTRRYLQTRSS